MSHYEMYWYPWDDTKEEIWIRPMPKHSYVINLKNNPITTYSYKMHQEDLARQFGRWYRMAHGGGKTVCLLGIRADESLQRYSGILNKKYGYKDTCWISRQFKDVWCASPLYRLVFKRCMARQQPFRLRLQQAVRLILYGGIKAGSDACGFTF